MNEWFDTHNIRKKSFENIFRKVTNPLCFEPIINELNWNTKYHFPTSINGTKYGKQIKIPRNRLTFNSCLRSKHRAKSDSFQIQITHMDTVAVNTAFVVSVSSFIGFFRAGFTPISIIISMPILRSTPTSLSFSNMPSFTRGWIISFITFIQRMSSVINRDAILSRVQRTPPPMAPWHFHERKMS